MDDDIVTQLDNYLLSRTVDDQVTVPPRFIVEVISEIKRLREAGDRLAYWALQEHLAGELISAAKAWKEARRG